MSLLADGHHGVELDEDDRDRLVTWLDTYAQRLGSFSDDQEARLVRLREAMAPILTRWTGLLNEEALSPSARRRPDTWNARLRARLG
ncbi:MAG TPA: hypothetical protein QGH10_19480 [Armatimonadota bacterium]|nr:hypothetical protein [Armatimonadota bacterium]